MSESRILYAIDWTHPRWDDGAGHKMVNTDGLVPATVDDLDLDDATDMIRDYLMELGQAGGPSERMLRRIASETLQAALGGTDE